MKSPEELELETKQAELEQLKGQLADKELELATLEASLASFSQRYSRIVGIKFAELDRIEAEIAEKLAARNPSDSEKVCHAQEARARATETEASLGEALSVSDQAPKSDELKKLYREAAKKMHPDLTDDPVDRERRQNFMARANDAYRLGDENALRHLLEEWQYSPETVKGQGLQAELVRAIRRIAQGRKRLLEIDSRLADLSSSDLFRLRQRVLASEEAGGDLLREMSESVETQIRNARMRLSRIP